MKKWIKSLAAIIALSVASGLACASDKGSAPEATAMVKKAVALYKKEGKDKAYAAIQDANNKEFHDRDLYVFVYDMKGNSVAHGNNPRMVGKNLLEMTDSDGKPIIKGFIDIIKTKGSGWYDYKWPNPVTKNVENKSAYIEQVDDVLIGAGIYK